MTSRTLLRQHPAVRDDIGDLVTRRPLPGPGIELLDPFLFLTHHGPQTYPPRNRGLPFGPHPHRGFETVTFILEGELAHHDTGGGESIIRKGGVQWMTAWRGLVHAELSPESFKAAGGPLEILQLWVNLPARLKMTEPRYVGLQQDAIPTYEADDGKAKVELVSGDWDGHEGPFNSITGLMLAVVRLEAGGRVALPAPRGHGVFLYVVSGYVDIAGATAREHHLIELADDGDEVELSARAPAVLLYGHGAPFREPVVSHGPFVMNTREEIIGAIRDYQAGKMG